MSRRNPGSEAATEVRGARQRLAATLEGAEDQSGDSAGAGSAAGRARGLLQLPEPVHDLRRTGRAPVSRGCGQGQECRRRPCWASSRRSWAVAFGGRPAPAVRSRPAQGASPRRRGAACPGGCDTLAAGREMTPPQSREPLRCMLPVPWPNREWSNCRREPGSRSHCRGRRDHGDGGPGPAQSCCRAGGRPEGPGAGPRRTGSGASPTPEARRRWGSGAAARVRPAAPRSTSTPQGSRNWVRCRASDLSWRSGSWTGAGSTGGSRTCRSSMRLTASVPKLLEALLPLVEV